RYPERDRGADVQPTVLVQPSVEHEVAAGSPEVLVGGVADETREAGAVARADTAGLDTAGATSAGVGGPGRREQADRVPVGPDQRREDPGQRRRLRPEDLVVQIRRRVGPFGAQYGRGDLGRGDGRVRHD